MPEINNEEQKEIFKEAISEWLDKQFAAFGKWTFAGLASAGLVALVYFILNSQGWHK
jgi:hypothetical protein